MTILGTRSCSQQVSPEIIREYKSTADDDSGRSGLQPHRQICRGLEHSFEQTVGGPGSQPCARSYDCWTPQAAERRKMDLQSQMQGQDSVSIRPSNVSPVLTSSSCKHLCCREGLDKPPKDQKPAASMPVVVSPQRPLPSFTSHVKAACSQAFAESTRAGQNPITSKDGVNVVNLAGSSSQPTRIVSGNRTVGQRKELPADPFKPRGLGLAVASKARSSAMFPSSAGLMVTGSTISDARPDGQMLPSSLPSPQINPRSGGNRIIRSPARAMPSEFDDPFPESDDALWSLEDLLGSRRANRSLNTGGFSSYAPSLRGGSLSQKVDDANEPGSLKATTETPGDTLSTMAKGTTSLKRPNVTFQGVCLHRDPTSL